MGTPARAAPARERAGRPPPSPRKRSFWSVAALLLLMVSVDSGGWPTDQATLPQPARDVTAAAQRELRAVASAGEPAAASLPGDQAAWAGDQTGPDWHGQQQVAQHDDPLATGSPADQNSMAWWEQHGRTVSALRAAMQTSDPETHLDIELHTVEFYGEQAVVSIVTSAQDGAPLYRQTRFYRRTAAGWQRTAPDATLWGPERSLETPSFIYHFRQNDAAVVIAVAPQIEALYTTLRSNFGLPVTSGAEKLVIEVSMTQPSSYEATWFGASGRILVPSPVLYWAPVKLTDAELLAQSVALLLLASVLAQASEQFQIGAAWQPLMRGLYLWHVWDMALPLAAWRENVVTWLYADEPTIPPGQPVVLPAHYEALCAAHTLWLLSPVQLGIPLLCTELDGQNWYYPA